MKLTIVTATFNAIDSGNREALIRCIESIERLPVDHEHLVYDGASVDGTVELLREYATRMPSLRVVSEKDTGIYNALNKGVRDASGEWFYVLGCDDCILNGKNMIRALEIGEKSGADAVATPVFVSEDGSKSVGILRNHEFCGVYPHQGILMQTTLIRKHGGFNDSYAAAADYDLVLHTMQSGARYVYSKAPFAYFSRGGLSGNLLRTNEEYAKIMQDRLGLTQSEAGDLQRFLTLPFRVALRYLVHRSPQLRQAARYHLLRLFARSLGLMNDQGAMIWNQVRKGC